MIKKSKQDGIKCLILMPFYKKKYWKDLACIMFQQNEIWPFNEKCHFPGL